MSIHISFKHQIFDTIDPLKIVSHTNKRTFRSLSNQYHKLQALGSYRKSGVILYKHTGEDSHLTMAVGRTEIEKARRGSFILKQPTTYSKNFVYLVANETLTKNLLNQYPVPQQNYDQLANEVAKSDSQMISWFRQQILIVPNTDSWLLKLMVLGFIPDKAINFSKLAFYLKDPIYDTLIKEEYSNTSRIADNWQTFKKKVEQKSKGKILSQSTSPKSISSYER